MHRTPYHFTLSFCSKRHCGYASNRSHIDVIPEITRYYGADANKKSILNAFQRYVKQDVKMLNDTLDAGGNPKNLDFSRFSLGPASG
jgi:hypothetical protein